MCRVETTFANREFEVTAMPLARLRFTMRKLVVAVALSAVALAPVALLSRRRDRFRALAALHASQVAGYTMDNSGFRPRYLDRDGRPVSARDGERDRWHGEMKFVFDQAALRPWASLPPHRQEPHWDQYDDVPPLPRKPATIADELIRQAYRSRVLKELARQPHYSRWLEEQERRFPF